MRLSAGEIEAQAGHFAEAREAFADALRMARTSGAPPATQARCARRLGEMRRELAEHDAAIEACLHAVRITQGLVGDEPRQERVRSLTEYAAALVGAGRQDEAEPSLDEALSLSDPSTEADGAWALRVLAEVRVAQGRYEEADEIATRAVDALIGHVGARTARTAHALNTAGIPALHLDRLDEADRRLREALELRRELLPEGHPQIADSLHNVAAVALARANLEEAEQLEREALAIWTPALGEDHPTLAVALGNIAAIAGKRGQYAEAERLYRRGLEIREGALGPDHPRLATSVNNLASVLDKLGRHEEAEQLFRRSLAIAERAHGRVHPDVARALNNLFNVLRTQGRTADGEAMLQRAIEVWEKCLPDSRELAVSLGNLATLHKARGEYDEAENVLLRCLAITQRQVGPDHPDLATPLNNLADLYATAGRWDQAEELFLRALRLREQAGHRTSPETLSNLADVARRQGRVADAVRWVDRAIGVVEQDLGGDSTALVPLLWQLARLQRMGDDSVAAVSSLERALQVQERALGAEHPDLATTLTALGGALDASGDAGGAELAYRRGIAILDAAGSADGRMAELLVLLGHRLTETDRPDEARELLRRALGICLESLGPDHRLTGSALTWLGYAEMALGEQDEAEQHLRAALEVRGSGDDHGSVGATIALHGLRRAYRNRGRNDELAEVLERLIALRGESGKPDSQFDRLIRELADLRFQSTRYRDAVELYRRVLAVAEQVERHPMYVASSNFCLAISLGHLGDTDAADHHFVLAAAKVRESGGGYEADLLHCLATHLDFRRARGRLEAALELAQPLSEAMRSPELALEAVARGNDSLGRLYAATGRWDDAERAFRTALAAWKRSTQPGATGNAVTTRYELARLTHVRGAVDEAELAYATLQSDLEGMGPSAGPALIRVLEDHARLLTESGRGDEAKSLLRRAEEVAAQLG